MSNDKIKAGAAPEEPAGASVSIKTELSEEAAKAPQSGPAGGSVSIKTELSDHEPVDSPLPPEWRHKAPKLRDGGPGAESAGASIARSGEFRIEQLTAEFQEKDPETTGAIGGAKKGLNNLKAVEHCVQLDLDGLRPDYIAGNITRKALNDRLYSKYVSRVKDLKNESDPALKRHKQLTKRKAREIIYELIDEKEKNAP